MFGRREFLKGVAVSAGAVCASPLEAFAKKVSAKKLRIGHTCITWNTFHSSSGDDATLDLAMKDIAAEGFWYFETFPEVLDNWDQRGKLEPLIAEYRLPLLSGYITGDLIDPSKRRDEIARIVRLSKVVKKFSGNVYRAGTEWRQPRHL